MSKLYIRFEGLCNLSEWWLVDDITVTGDEAAAPSVRAPGFMLNQVQELLFKTTYSVQKVAMITTTP